MTSLLIFLSLGLAGWSAPVESLPPTFYREEIQPLLNGRCVVCHSCFESPCQMNLQTWSGVQRGAFRSNVYDGSRLSPVQPTRMFQDAMTTEEWRSKGFFDVLSGGDQSLFWRMVKMNDLRQVLPSEASQDNLTCVSNTRAIDLLERHKPEYGMPYGFPSLEAHEKEKLSKWLKAGAPGNPDLLGLSTLEEEDQKIVRRWENFLNGQDLKRRVLARYLWEHLFIASFQIPGKDHLVLRLMRSQKPCGEKLVPVATRQPNDDPRVKDWFYCFYRDPAAAVYKKHIPYELSQKKLDWIQQNFEIEKWKATQFPSFSEQVSRNPFVAFREIPAAARYRFLLEDARYHIMTFIKGPVCNGSIAVNVIEEQFYVFFIDPRFDVNLQDREFARQSEKLLLLPGNFDAQPGVTGLMDDLSTLTELRNQYRQMKARVVQKKFPHGMGLDVIWDGKGENPNAALTVFRHHDSAEVVGGAKGDLPKTVFILDYSIFERLAYNLVVNFDVFGDVKHQALTRLYMDLIRMEAENNYLEFLPPEDRLPLKESWYQGLLTRLRLELLREDQFPAIPNKIKLTGSGDNRVQENHRQLVGKILFERLSPAVRGEDPLNWKTWDIEKGEKLSSVEKALRSLTSVKARDGGLYAKYVPEFSLVAVREDRKVTDLYSMIRHREHLNISWMFGESLRLDPDSDSISILPGVTGSYPYQIFTVERSQIESFAQDLKKVSSKKSYDVFEKKWGLSRRDPQFWPQFDGVQNLFADRFPREFGILDLSRYHLQLQDVSGAGLPAPPGTLHRR